MGKVADCCNHRLRHKSFTQGIYSPGTAISHALNLCTPVGVGRSCILFLDFILRCYKKEFSHFIYIKKDVQ